VRFHLCCFYFPVVSWLEIGLKWSFYLLGSPAASVHYDPELEKQRLAFEMQKYEEEKAERLRLETVCHLQQIADEKSERLRLEAKAGAVRLQQIEDDKAER